MNKALFLCKRLRVTDSSFEKLSATGMFSKTNDMKSFHKFCSSGPRFQRIDWMVTNLLIALWSIYSKAQWIGISGHYHKCFLCNEVIFLFFCCCRELKYLNFFMRFTMNVYVFCYIFEVPFYLYIFLHFFCIMVLMVECQLNYTLKRYSY